MRPSIVAILDGSRRSRALALASRCARLVLRSWPWTRPSAAVVTSFGRGRGGPRRRARRRGPALQVALAERPARRPPAPRLRPAAARGDHGRQAEPRGRLATWSTAWPTRSGSSAARARSSRPRRGSNERVSAALSDAIGRRDLAALATTEPRGLGARRRDRERPSTPSPRRPGGAGDRGGRPRAPAVQSPAGGPAGGLRADPQRAPAGRRHGCGPRARPSTPRSPARPTAQRDTILAKAEAEAERIRGQAEAEATRILNEAHGRDPQVLRVPPHARIVRAILDSKTTVVLSSSSPLLRLLTQGPAEELPAASPRDGTAGWPARGGQARSRAMSARTRWFAIALGRCRRWRRGASGVRIVRPGERIVVRRFGRLVEPAWGPGPALGLAAGPRPVRPRAHGQVRRWTSASAGARRRGRSRRRRVPHRRPEPGAGPGGRPVSRESPSSLCAPGDVASLPGAAGRIGLAQALSRRPIDPVLRVDRRAIAGEIGRDLKV